MLKNVIKVTCKVGAIIYLVDKCPDELGAYIGSGISLTVKLLENLSLDAAKIYYSTKNKINEIVSNTKAA